MWVRSQDKKILANCKLFEVEEIDDCWLDKNDKVRYEILGLIDHEYHTLGKYSVKRAIRVMKEIQYRIENKYTGVYQMPDE